MLFRVKSLADLLRLGRTIRVLGFDDAPFEHIASQIEVAGIVCAHTRFEGMLWGRATRDGADATDALIGMCRASKFHAQVHLILIDGLAVGGFNLVDLPRLAAILERPCVAVMRRPPDMDAITRALRRFDDFERRMDLIARAGPVHQFDPFCFQVAGAKPALVARCLDRLTDRGHVPEALRLAHLIGSAVKTGESGKRA